MQHATSLRELSNSARETADKLEFFESAVRAEGCALALVRFREKHGERRALVDLSGAATELRAYAALIEAEDRVVQRRMKRQQAKAQHPDEAVTKESPTDSPAPESLGSRSRTP